MALTLREIQTKLGATVEDTVLQKLGYREWAVTPSGASAPLPFRPEVIQLDGYPKQLAYNDYLTSGYADTPRNFYVVKISRHDTPLETLTVEGRWTLQQDGQDPVEVTLAKLVQTDDRFLATLVEFHTVV